MTRIFTIAAMAVAAAGLLAAQAGAQTPAATGPGVSGGQLTWGVTTEPACFNPHRSSQQNAFLVIRNYVDSLVGKRADGVFVPWLATSWSVSPDGKAYTFQLREDVKFHDGTPFDAEAVKANFDFIRNPKSSAAAASFLEFYQRTEVVGRYTVRVVLSQPDSALLESVSSVKLGFLSPKTLAEDKDLCAGGPALVGTGPFIFEQYQRGQSATFRRNPDYNWAPAYAAHQGPAYLDRVTYRFLPEYAVRTGALSSGQVDLIEGVQPTDISAFKGVKGFQYHTGPSSQTSFTLNINYRRGVAQDIRVRRALRDGFDIDGLVRGVYLDTVPRAWSNIGPDNAGYSAKLKGSWGNRVAEANRLLDEAGWTGRDAQGYRTKDGQRLSIEVGYPQPYVRDNRDVLIQGIQAALRKNLGFELKLRLISNGEWVKSTAEGSWIIYPNTLNPSDPALELRDVLGDTGFLYKEVPNPEAGRPDPEIAALIREARATSDLARRQPILDRIQAIAVDRAYVVPLFAPNYQVAAKSRVQGISFEAQLDSPANSYDLWIQQ
ncbi:MAG: ABC transporter substrate-binding protein [Comamonas sp.]